MHPNRLFLAALVALVACGSDPVTQAPWSEGAVPLARSVAYVDSANGRVVLLDAKTPTPVLRVVELGGVPGAVAPSEDGSRLLVLVPETDALISVRDGTAAETRWDVGAPFTGLSVAEDGGVAVAFFQSGVQGGIFQNANELAVVDLGTSEDPTLRTVRSFGTAPDSVTVSPEATLGGKKRRIALVQSTSHIAVLDLSEPAARDVSVPLATTDTDTPIAPQQVELAAHGSGDDAALWAFLRAPSSPDVFALRVTHNPAYAKDKNVASLSVTMNVFYSGQTPSDMLVLEGEAGPRLLVVNRDSRTVALIDAETAEVATLSTGAKASRALRTEGGERDLVLLVDQDGASTGFHVLDLDALAGGDGKVLSTYKTALPIGQVTLLEGTTRAVVSHGASDSWGSSGGLSLIDLATGDVVPFTSTGGVVGMAPAPGGKELLVATVLNGQGYLVRLDLATLHPDATQLVARPTGLAVLPDAGRLVVDMTDSGGGLLTLWPAAKAAPESAVVLGGFLFEGLLDRED